MAKAARERRALAQAAGQPYERPGKMWSLREGLRGSERDAGRRIETPTAVQRRRPRHPPRR